MKRKMAKILLIADLMVIGGTGGCYFAAGGFGRHPHHGGYYQDRYDGHDSYLNRGYQRDRGGHRGWRDKD